MKFIRWFLGRVILLLNFVFSPRGVTRSASEQTIADNKAKDLSLYQFEACPFCVKVRRELKRQSINISLRDAKNNDAFREELQNEGGRVKVPCLRIEKEGKVEWMYESSDIINYLQKEFA